MSTVLRVDEVVQTPSGTIEVSYSSSDGQGKAISRTLSWPDLSFIKEGIEIQDELLVRIILAASIQSSIAKLAGKTLTFDLSSPNIMALSG